MLALSRSARNWSNMNDDRGTVGVGKWRVGIYTLRPYPRTKSLLDLLGRLLDIVPLKKNKKKKLIGTSPTRMSLHSALPAV